MQSAPEVPDVSAPFKNLLQGITDMVFVDAEAVQIWFDPSEVTYQQLLEFFYKMHDPTTVNQQGLDMGSQYKSGIFYHDAQQEAIARDVTKRVSAQWWNNKVVTEILPVGQWWNAEEYHQRYMDNNPDGEHLFGQLYSEH